jgi:predicted NAD/FAD-dependent oxidoreductase
VLKARGAHVVVFEAARRPGGRAASEITPAGRFDHGAQYFTAQSAEFEGAVAAWVEAGLVQRWTAQVIAIDGERTIDQTESAKRFVARDGMQALTRRLGDGVDLRLGAAVASIGRRGNSWEVRDAAGAALSPGGYDAAIAAVPQAAELLREVPALAQRAQRVVWQPCWAALLATESASGFDFGGAFVNDHAVLAWVSRENSKPAAGADGGGERWVLHATARWSALHLNHAPDDVAATLAESFAQRFNFGFHSTFLAGRRWLTALPSNPLNEPYLWDAERRIGAAGDWCGGGQARFEGAFLSGRALAAAIAA